MIYLKDKTVLITGGCGSIGSTLVKRVLDKEPAQVRILDTDERSLYSLRNELAEEFDETRFLLGDVRDKSRIEMAMEDVDVVFHAAALKHVDLTEYNPFEAVRTNVQGTQNTIESARQEAVDSFITVSTDKASNPISVMGATKMLAERLTVAANTYKGDRATSFGCVRFGNVASSNGSVIPLFLRQLQEGGPLTVTDPEMTRFIMSVDRAVSMTLKAAERLQGGEVYILKMRAFRLGDLVDTMRTEFAPQFGKEPEEIEIQESGPRPGERYHEKLISADECRYVEETEDMYILYPQIPTDYEITAMEAKTGNLRGPITSEDAEMLAKNELVKLINETSSIVSIERDR